MPNFMIISDENYAPVLRVSLKKIQEIYPDSKIFLYDWGLNEGTRSTLKEKIENLSLIDWTEPIQRARRRLGNSLPGILFWLLNRKGLRARYIFERLLVQKLLCIKHCSELVGNEEIFWFDADVVLLAPVHEIREENHDFIFTLRRSHEFNFAKNKCQVINVGVVFLGPDRVKRDLFLDKWIDRTKRTREYCREQTAVTRIFEPGGREIFRDYASFNHAVGGTDISVKFYPCEKYNFNWIEEAIADPSLLANVKLLHFKGRRHDPENFCRLMSGLRLF